MKVSTPQLILIVILMMGLINGLMSCTNTKTVYNRDAEGKVWRSDSKTSAMTGYKYNSK